jgi:hypothetical protein
MPNSDVSRINRALESVAQVGAVNCLIQRICCSMSESELSEREAQGLYALIDWQNMQMERAVSVIKTELDRAALV